MASEPVIVTRTDYLPTNRNWTVTMKRWNMSTIGQKQIMGPDENRWGLKKILKKGERGGDCSPSSKKKKKNRIKLKKN